MLFQYNHDEADLRSVLELHGIEAERVDAHSSGPPIDLYLGLHHGPDRTVGRLHYDPRLFTATEAEQLSEEFVAFARAAVAAPDEPFPQVHRSGVAAAVHDPFEVPLSYAQERMWTIEQMEPGTSQYVMRMVYRISGPIDVRALEAALTDVVARHDVLRMRIASDAGRPRGFIDPPWPVELERYDLSTTTEKGGEVEPEPLLDERFLAPFALEEGHLLRAGLIALGGDETILVLSFHHIVIDGQSYAILTDDLHECYDAHRTGRPARLEPLEHQYADFAAHQRQRAADDAYARSLEFWDQVLAAPLPPSRIGQERVGGAPTDGVAAAASLTPRGLAGIRRPGGPAPGDALHVGDGPVVGRLLRGSRQRRDPPDGRAVRSLVGTRRRAGGLLRQHRSPAHQGVGRRHRRHRGSSRPLDGVAGQSVR